MSDPDRFDCLRVNTVDIVVTVIKLIAPLSLSDISDFCRSVWVLGDRFYIQVPAGRYKVGDTFTQE